MAIQGLRTTANFIANARPENWRQGVMLLYPNGSAPLTALTSLMKEDSTTDPNFHWFEKAMQTRRLKLTANLNNTDVSTALAVESGALAFKEGDMFLVEATQEVVFASANPSADNAITVVRGVAGTTKTAVTVASANPYVVCIGSAYEEGSAAPVGIAFDPTEYFNYTQIFRNTHEITGTAANTDVRTGNEWNEQKRETLELHSVDMERAFWFGRRGLSSRNGKPWRQTGGILSVIPGANITDYFSTPIDIASLEDMLFRMFLYGSNEKIAFAGNRALLSINRAIRLGKNVSFNIKSGEKEYGMDVSRLTCPFGTLVIKTHPLWNQMGGVLGSYAGMDSSLVVLDMKEIRYRYLKNRDTKYEQNIQEDGVDAKKNGYITECGLQVGHASTHFWFKGLVAAAEEA